jgi:hypothetical protein
MIDASNLKAVTLHIYLLMHFHIFNNIRLKLLFTHTHTYTHTHTHVYILRGFGYKMILLRFFKSLCSLQ